MLSCLSTFLTEVKCEVLFWLNVRALLNNVWNSLTIWLPIVDRERLISSMCTSGPVFCLSIVQYWHLLYRSSRYQSCDLSNWITTLRFTLMEYPLILITCSWIFHLFFINMHRNSPAFQNNANFLALCTHTSWNLVFFFKSALYDTLMLNVCTKI